MGVHREEDGREIYYDAIHRQVLIVYVPGYNNDWKAYVVPVPGESHASEVYLWERDGCPLSESRARALWPTLAAHYDEKGLTWRD